MLTFSSGCGLICAWLIFLHRDSQRIRTTTKRTHTFTLRFVVFFLLISNCGIYCIFILCSKGKQLWGERLNYTKNLFNKIWAQYIIEFNDLQTVLSRLSACTKTFFHSAKERSRERGPIFCVACRTAISLR